MRMRCLALGLVVSSLWVSQGSEAQALVTRVYRGNDFGDYYLDPPFWSYRSKGFRDAKTAHWLYKNHRRVYIDIQLN